MSILDGQVSASFHLGPKGRVVLPVAVRRAAHLEEGTELVARLVGEGQVLLESRDAVRARVWAGAPTATGGDVTSDVRTMRDEDIAVEADNARRRDAQALDHEDGESAAAGAALLAHLGL